MLSSPPIFAEQHFRKASASYPSRNCVRVARRDGWVEVRDDKTFFGAPDDHRLVFTAEQFEAFQAGVRSSQPEGRCLEMTHRNGVWIFRSTVPQPASGEFAELTFTDAEVAAFLNGIHHAEFDVLDTTIAA